MSSSVYLITGPSGAGKTTVSDYLGTQGYTCVEADSTPGLCYFANKNMKPVPYPPGADAAWWSRHSYVWELDRLRRLLDNLESNGKPVFLCGNAGNIAKAQHLFKAIYYLDIPTDIMLERVAGGTEGYIFGQRVEEKDQLVRWAGPFKQEMAGLGAITIDATQPVAKVATNILDHVKQAAA
jgi:gluconate kinase